MSHVHSIFHDHKVCVLLPTYNNAQTLRDVLTDVLQYTANVIVVNDGSTDSTVEILSEFRSIEVVSYETNQGKGYALRRGLQRARDLEYEYAISIDSDGQHFANDLPVFLNEIANGYDGLLVGRRNMDQASVPGKSNFGRNFSNFWYRVETGLRLEDTQSGYRCYPVRPMTDLKFFTVKFEFEIEVLVRAAWSGVPVKEVPVKVFYPAKDERISHFRPFADFTRISILNTVLVTIALLYIKPRDFFLNLKKKSIRQHLEHLFLSDESDMRKAVSVGFGVFMGIFPIWGFQLISAIALAFLLRLNKALVIIAANISIPPMIPFILYFSHWIGGLWMGDDAIRISLDQDLSLGTLSTSFLQYVVGAITLAVLAGALFLLLTYVTVKAWRASKQR